KEKITETAGRLQASLNIHTGPLLKVALFREQEQDTLLIIIHHLVTDGVSWRILLEDVETLYRLAIENKPLQLPEKSMFFGAWPQVLDAYRQSREHREALEYWKNALQKETTGLPRNFSCAVHNSRFSVNEVFTLNKTETTALLQEAGRPFRTNVAEQLLTAFLLAVHETSGHQAVRVDMEAHGRELLLPGADTGRTIGWFTSIYPVIVEMASGALSETIRQVKESVRSVPNNGIDYLLFSNTPGTNLQQQPAEAGRVLFNYLGETGMAADNSEFSLLLQSRGDEVAPGEIFPYDWNISAMVHEGLLSVTLMYSTEQYRPETIKRLMESFNAQLVRLITYCCAFERQLLTPSDCSYKKLTLSQLDELQQQYDVQDVYPMSPMQEGMSLHILLGEDKADYFAQVKCTLKGTLVPEQVQQAMNQLVKRHEVLRTVFITGGFNRGLQVVLPQREIEFSYADITRLNDEEKQNTIEHYCRNDKQRAFDITRDVLMRLGVFQVTGNEYILVWSHHHLLMDGWCIGIVVNEFREIYTHSFYNRPLLLPPVAPYARYINWVEQQGREEAVNYWAQYLLGFETPTGLPLLTGSNAAGGYQRETVQLAFSKTETAALRQLAVTAGVTTNTVVQAAWALLLSLYNNTSDVLYGAVVSGRPSAVPGIETMVGLFINTVPVRVQIDAEETITGLLQSVQANAAAGEPWHYLALSEIQALSLPGRELINHILVFENYPFYENLEGSRSHNDPNNLFEVTGIDYTVQTGFNLTIIAADTHTIHIGFDFNARVFSATFIQQVALGLKKLLLLLAAQPSNTVQQLLAQVTTAMVEDPQRFTLPLWQNLFAETIQQQLEKSFLQNAAYTAIEHEGIVYSYAMLEQRANRVAAALLQQGVVAEQFVGILCSSRLWTISAMLGILKTGAAFVPLETNLPPARIGNMIVQSGCRVVITDVPQPAILLEETAQPVWITTSTITEQKGVAAWVSASPHSPAYVYFTSGSTGNPKGVVGRNIGLLHFIEWEINRFGIGPGFRFAQFTNPGFDVFMRDILVPLCAGATICIPSEEDVSAGTSIAGFIANQRISFIHCVPGFFRLFTAQGVHSNSFPELKYILLAGEKVVPADLNNWYAQTGNRIQLVNIYGPTETTLAKGCYFIQPSDVHRKHMPVVPIPGAQFLVLDRNRQLCLPGAVGEIYIRTPYRSLGYTDQQLTSAAFIPNPLGTDSTDLVYKTGDAGMVNEAGEITILGRTDQQVKIRGIRIEPDDVRINMLAYPELAEAAVVVKYDETGEPFLAAYFVTQPGAVVDKAELHTYLQNVLPRYMVPAYLQQLDKMPLLPNGKLDRRSLPLLRVAATGAQQAENETEQQLVTIWATLLQLPAEQVGVETSFFALGGHSLKVFHLINKIKEQFSVSFKFGEVFFNNTIRSQAIFINSRQKVEYTGLQPVPTAAHYPASPAQQRMFYQQMRHSGETMFNISTAVKIKPGASRRRIQQALHMLTARHESLRTSFFIQPEGVVQKVYEQVLFEPEIRTVAAGETIAGAFHRFIRPFNLAEAPLARVAFLETPEQETLLLFDIHHIIADGTSLNILVSDFKKMFMGEALAPLPARYIDYAAWINKVKDNLNEQLSYWAQQLSGELPQLLLPVNEVGSDVNWQLADVRTLVLPENITRLVNERATAAGVTGFMYLVSVFYILLSKLTGSSDIIIATDAIGRTLPETQNMVGTFVNILPLRVQVEPELSFSSLLENVKTTITSAFANQDIQFDQMVEMTGASTSGRKPITGIHCSFSNVVEEELENNWFGPVSLNNRKDESSEYELKLEFQSVHGELHTRFIYSRALYSEAIIDLFTQYYRNIIQQAIHGPETLVSDIDPGNYTV
ncbi:MAG: amino acid adenylation domain-containing protein, partial [Dinghuibacter sp.]|nr:amino acid adenylation domain-containing protein [Dinghuibacter sp.]